MNFDWKKALRALGMTLFIGLFLGGALLVAILFASLMGLAPYLQHVLWVLGGTILLAAILLGCGYLSSRAKKLVGIGVLCVALGCAGYAGVGLYRDSIPTVDDRALLLWDYVPFEEDSKAVQLEEPADFRLENVYSLRLDGATALYPIYAGFVQAAWPEPTGEQNYNPKNSMVECNGTISAYERLINGEANVIFVAEPSQAQLEMAKQAGKELHLTPIGREAFVFFVNSKNPVTGLTVEQIQGIYTGDITSWKEVGGMHQKIRPFQRDENSGSQTALQTLMAGLPLMAPEEEDRVAGMGGIIRQVASYRNYKNAIGFSFRYYSTEMVQNGDIRLLALNGVEPTKETIRDGSYPIASHFYAVTVSRIGEPAPQETNKTLAAFLDWIQSPQGQEIVEKTGYVGLQ